MTALFTNNAASTLASGITNSDLSLTVSTGDGALFPSPTGGDYFDVTLTQGGGTAETTWEIVHCTSRTGDVLTIIRAQEGTAAAAWASGSKVELRLTVTTFTTVVENQTHAASSKTTPVDNDEIPLADSAASYGLKKLLWSSLKTTLGFVSNILGSANGGTGNGFTKFTGPTTSEKTFTLPDVSSSIAILGANTFTGLQTFLNTKETTYNITDGAAFEIDPVNGNIQTITLGASRTPKATNLASGQSVLLGIDDGTAYTITWTDATLNPTWVKSGGTASAPALATTGYTWVLLWKVSSTVYGAIVGSP